MIATIWGSRGSLATPGATTLEYERNTSRLELAGRSPVGPGAIGESSLLTALS